MKSVHGDQVRAVHEAAEARETADNYQKSYEAGWANACRAECGGVGRERFLGMDLEAYEHGRASYVPQGNGDGEEF